MNRKENGKTRLLTGKRRAALRIRDPESAQLKIACGIRIGRHIVTKMITDGNRQKKPEKKTTIE
mgnify:FL=1